MHTITPVIMSGGAGTRLWPLSRAARPKQFHALVPPSTMLQATVERARDGAELGVAFADPVVVCNAEHAELVQSQLAEAGVTPGAIVLEPVGRNTAACAVVASEVVRGIDPSGLVLLLPSDHHVADAAGFRAAVARAAQAASEGALVTFGVRPTRAETGYGYILAEGAGDVMPVQQFVEKPDAATAERYFADGRYYWNAGIFLFRADRLLEEMGRFRPDILHGGREALAEAGERTGVVRLGPSAFTACPSESLDVAVMESTADAVVAPIHIGWSDIGSFEALWDISAKDGWGNAAPFDALLVGASDSFVASDGPVVALVGVSDLVVIVDNGVVLVAAKSQSQRVKEAVTAAKAHGRSDLL